MLAAPSAAPYPGVRVAPFNRAPTANDDSAHGYAVGNYWNYCGRIYQCLSAAAGAAIWVLLLASAGGYLVDQMGGGAYSAYGIVKFIQAYTGNCCQVTRTSDGSVLTVGWVWDGSRDVYRIDWAAIEAFLAQGTGYFTLWYDQSGNGNNCAPVITANGTTYRQQLVQFKTLLNGLRVVVFSSDNSGAGSKMGLQLPAGHSVSSQSVSGVMLGAHAGAGGEASAIFWYGATSPNSLGLVNNYNNGAVGGMQAYANGNAYTNINPPSGPAVTTLESGASNRVIRLNEQSTILAPATSENLAGGGIGFENYGGFYGGRFDWVGTITFSRQLTTADRAILWPWAYSFLAVVPQFDVNLVFGGDSITGANLTALNRSHPECLPDLLGEKVRRYNIGVPGYEAAQLDGAFATAITPLYVEGKTNWLVLMIGTNDLAILGLTNTQLFAHHQSICAQAHTVGFKVLISTITPRADSYNAAVQSYNTYLRGVWSTIADAFVDIGADPTLAANVTNTAWSPDGLHWTDEPHNVMANYIAALSVGCYREAPALLTVWGRCSIPKTIKLGVCVIGLGEVYSSPFDPSF